MEIAQTGARLSRLFRTIYDEAASTACAGVNILTEATLTRVEVALSAALRTVLVPNWSRDSISVAQHGYISDSDFRSYA